MPLASVQPEPDRSPIRLTDERLTGAHRVVGESRFAGLALAASSLLFAALQSICVFFAAVDGLRVTIGISSAILAASTADAIDAFHVDWLRVPMIGLALAGALLNLLVLWQVRRLRGNPAAQWRQRPVSPGRLRMERVQLTLSVLTLVLLALEERQHLLWLKHV